MINIIISNPVIPYDLSTGMGVDEFSAELGRLLSSLQSWGYIEAVNQLSV